MSVEYFSKPERLVTDGFPQSEDAPQVATNLWTARDPKLEEEASSAFKYPRKVGTMATANESTSFIMPADPAIMIICRSKCATAFGAGAYAQGMKAQRKSDGPQYEENKSFF